MLTENTLSGIRNKVHISIERLKAFEPAEGYYLAFSGGKDSLCIYHLAIEAGVKFEAHYNITTVDPPELVRFIRRNYPDVIFDKPVLSMRELIINKGSPPFRKGRYCCSELKEGNGQNRICVTGVRWAESNSRKLNHGIAETFTSDKNNRILFEDNDEGRRLFETCMQKSKRLVNPIVDWLDEDVWEYIHSRNIKYCCLYDEGYTRLGCIGCPMASEASRSQQFERWPQYKKMYIKAFDEMIIRRKRKGLKVGSNWQTGEMVFDWWLHAENRKEQKNKLKILDGQVSMFEIEVN